MPSGMTVTKDERQEKEILCSLEITTGQKIERLTVGLLLTETAEHQFGWRIIDLEGDERTPEEKGQVYPELTEAVTAAEEILLKKRDRCIEKMQPAIRRASTLAQVDTFFA